MALADWGHIQFSGEITITRYVGEIGDDLREPLHCPECGTAERLTLGTQGDEGLVVCPICGHEWTDSRVTARDVRQMLHLAAMGQPSAFPNGQMQTVVFPPLDEDRTLAPQPEWVDDDPRVRWELGCLISTGTMFTHCLRAARHLSSFAIASDTGVYTRLYPQAGGSAVDAHMATVLVALSLYEIAFQARATKMFEIRLAQAVSALGPERARRVKDLRPIFDFDPDAPCHLRVTDANRMDTAEAHDWERWRRTAVEILEFSIQDIVNHSHLSKSADEVRASDRERQWYPDDLTWYTGNRV
ncbi:hypothetical protein J7W19_29395 [Streptomyces mobaraensis NBRC 13819 = DSM 40847]|uniref:Uncharacterized protein n=1 Tax=Streptomyces mobaraensis (strain ATCC 29032 / DSM 40847 / JCM 4168 / NBRC 13819 / NCIMB 11159 / IPCR 16-22) TaxID=1223523 RepID=M3B8R9_STRM1|nr:hypothetical protein [Streptomyces mobaraensis]EMF02398.1 hypothetical protein H340_01079 [Streptomyces mobaraensis NBRC 13819 = DSM 40847]QTT76953.1 hypothetical protein J7W19_29395 [Streptomyces mobaraensis NBRC 13819 = DSM 40847]